MYTNKSTHPPTCNNIDKCVCQDGGVVWGYTYGCVNMSVCMGVVISFRYSKNKK